MGSASASQSKQQGSSSLQGSSTSGNYSAGESWGDSGGMSLGQSTGTQDVWGAQQPALSALYAQARQLMGGQGAIGQGAAGVAGQARNAWADQLSPGGNPYFERSVQGAINSATTGFNQNVLPALDARGVATRQYGSERDNLARGQAAGDFGASLANQVGGMYAQQYQGDRALAGQALGYAPQMQAMQTAPLTTAAGIIGGPTVLGQQQSTSLANNYAQQGSTNTAQGWGSSQNTARSGNTGSSGSGSVGVMQK
jgi:hypothetical protein